MYSFTTDPDEGLKKFQDAAVAGFFVTGTYTPSQTLKDNKKPTPTEAQYLAAGKPTMPPRISLFIRKPGTDLEIKVARTSP